MMPSVSTMASSDTPPSGSSYFIAALDRLGPADRPLLALVLVLVPDLGWAPSDNSTDLVSEDRLVCLGLTWEPSGSKEKVVLWDGCLLEVLKTYTHTYHTMLTVVKTTLEYWR